MQKTIIFIFFFIHLNSCMSVKYEISKNTNKNETIRSAYVLFDFSTQANSDNFFRLKLLSALKENHINVSDTLTITPLSFITKGEIETKISSQKVDAVIYVMPLKSIIDNSKYGYGLNSISYLIEVKSTITSNIFKKCVISIKHPDNFGNVQSKLSEAIKNLLL